MDSLRKREENKRDSIVFSSKFIRVTNERLLRDGTTLLPLDTTLTNFENYSPLFQPRKPKIGLGSLGLAQRDLLFDPEKRLGFDVGVHFLDAYMLTPQDIQYYAARVAYTNLQLYTGGTKEQVFKATLAQNVNPNLNIGFNFNLIGSRGFYNRQNVSDLNAAIFSWYQSPGKRYNLLTNFFFNNLKTPESGGILNDRVFIDGSFDKEREQVRLLNAKYQILNNGFYMKQMYYIGRIDSTVTTTGKSEVLPTQRITHNLMVNTQRYVFSRNGLDTYRVFPDFYFNSINSRDSLAMQDIRNDFGYSFYLRPKSGGLLKNELKLDLGLMHDLYNYKQFVNDSVLTAVGKINMQSQKQAATFQNITLKARLGYRFSDRLILDADLQQIAQGRNIGDFLYDFKLSLAGGRKAGKIVFGLYAQNNAPALIDQSWISNHFVFNNTFRNQKIINASFNYINDALELDMKAEYFMINDYLYFEAQPNGIDAKPAQLAAPINLLKVSVGKNLTWRRFHFDNFVVYQKTDYQNTLRTPEVYTYSNLYYGKKFFNAIDLVLGGSVRYNTPYVAPSYAVGIGKFYNGADVTYNSYPYVQLYAKGTLQRTNLFIMYDYANQGFQSNGFYTVNRYPMQDKILKFGVSWTFYN
ncbi:putative porin [Mucilaginibacter myungsuensis]